MPILWNILLVGPVITGLGSIVGSLAVAYAAYWVASQFASKNDQGMPTMSAYPIQSSMNGIPKPKTYGTDRIAGNVIWMGPMIAYTVESDSGAGKGGGETTGTYETRYRRSFLISLGEGPANVLRAWKGKDEITLDSFTWFNGSDNSGIKELIGEDYGEYKHDACAFFDEWDLGNSEMLPNFTFEISTFAGYKYTYLSECYTLWGVPVVDRTALSLDAGESAINEGGGMVSLPCTNHPFQTGDIIQIIGTTYYDDLHTLTSGTTRKRLHFTYAYNAETFDGSQYLYKKITGLTVGYGRMAQDKIGNIYIGHLWYAAESTFVTKIEPDGTKVYDFLNHSWNGIDPPTSDDDVYGLKVTQDGKYLVIMWDRSDQLEMYDLTTGDLVWSIDAGRENGLDIDLDGEGNIYMASKAGIGIDKSVKKFNAADGSVETEYDNGDVATADSFAYAIAVSKRLMKTSNTSYDFEVVVAGGSAAGPDADDLVNLSIWDMDGTLRAQTALGGTYWGGSQYSTYIIGTGMLLIWARYIYVISYTPTCTLYKLDEDLNIITQAAGPTYGIGFYVDLWGNLVVVNQSWTTPQTDVLWFYDADLNYLSKISPTPQMLKYWDAAVGSVYQQGNAAFYRGLDAEQLDANPADIIEDILTHPRYGARQDTDIIHADSFEICRQYWYDQLMLISITLNESKPWQDWVDYILSHCGGYRFNSGGQIHLGVLRDESAVDALTNDDLVQPNPEAQNLPPKVQVTPRPYGDRFNRIEISWKDRENKYDLATVVAYDPVDIAVSGSIKKQAVKLMGITNAAYAQRMAYRFLIDALYRWNLYNFTVGYKKQLLETGDIVTLDDGQLLSGEKIRIMKVTEDRHGRGLNIVAMDDYAEHYPEIVFTPQTALYSPPAALVLADAAIYFREDVETARLYLSMVPGNASANGWYIYRSYDDVSYTLVGRCGIDGVTGGDANSAGTISGDLAAHPVMTWARDESVLVNIGTVTDLPTSITEDAFWHDRNLIRIDDEIMAYKDAEETATPGIWQISNLRRGLFGTEAAAHTTGATFCTLRTNFTYAFNESDIGQTFYFKALTYYGDTIQQLSEVEGFSVTIGGYYLRPGPVSLIRLNADENDNGYQYSGSSFSIYWNLPGLRSGYNYGTPGTVPWNNYIADPELQAIILKFEQEDGTAIGQREIAVGETASITKATDLEGYNPARIRVVPRRTFESRLQNSLLVDDGN